jgi:hypothetical protein
MRGNPAANSSWALAKRASPSRAPYSDEELERIRVSCSPGNLPAYPSGGSRSVDDLVIIWTLLDMLEKQKGWTKES